MNADVLLAELEGIIASNAVLLREAPSVGVRVLKDGRVRVFDLDLGWRRKGYREYTSLTTALSAARIAAARAARANELISVGAPASSAVSTAIAEVRP